MWLDEMGDPHLLTTVPPGRAYWQSTHVGTPWFVATDTWIGGLYFPTSDATIADIPDHAVSFADSQATGYVKPLSIGPRMPSQADLQHDDQGNASLDFVSFCPIDVNIYAVSSKHVATFITTLAPYHDFWAGFADSDTFWVVTDTGGTILETFAQTAYVAGTAVIAPTIASPKGGS